MESKYYTVRKFGKRYLTFFILPILIIIFLSFCTQNVFASTYIPAAPTGPEAGFLEINYEYIIYTTSSDAEWMFDWGNGTTSEWLNCQASENSITRSHSWNSVGEYQIRVKFRNIYFSEGVWSNPIIMTISEYTAEDLPNTPITPSGLSKGCISAEYPFSTYAKDPKNDNLQYRFDFGDKTISDWTKLVSSDTTSTVSHIWENTGEYEIKAQARDQYGLLSEWSKKLYVVIELDADLDGLSDNMETQLGSNINDKTDVVIININDLEYFIVYVSNDVALFYNPFLDAASLIKSNDDGTYLLDENNDGTCNYIYNPTDGSINNYVASESQSLVKIPWKIVGIIGIIIGIIFTILILIKTGYLYLYEDEYGVEE